MSRQINDNGIPLVSGLDVFVPIVTFGNERLSFNNFFTAQTMPRAAVSTRLLSYATEAVSTAGLPIFKNSNWFTYGTSGVFYTSIGTRIPASDNNKIVISAVVNGETGSSHSGIFQELKDLIPDNEYQVTVNLTANTNVGRLSLSRLYNASGEGNPLTQSNVTEFGVSNTTSQIVMDFKAYSPSDIIFIDYSSTVNLNIVEISSISVKEKYQYRLPVIVDSSGVESSNVLARKYLSAAPLDEGETYIE